MKPRPRVLIISDEPETAQVWGFSLSQVGLETRLVSVSEAVMQIWAEELPDLIIIEDFNDQVEELELLRQLRAETVVPILYLTGKTDEPFLVETYRFGSDETIPFPISPRLFQAKVSAWLRRTQSMPMTALDEVRAGGFILNPESRWLSLPSGDMVRLSMLEARLLYLLMTHPGRAFETYQLLERIWGYYGEGDSILLKNLVYRLRRKIEPDPAQPRYLVTEANLGYKFIAEEARPSEPAAENSAAPPAAARQAKG